MAEKLKVGDFVEVSKGKYDVIEIDDSGRCLYTNAELNLSGETQGLIIGAVCQRMPTFDVKVNFGRDREEPTGIYIIRVTPYNMEKIEFPLEDKGFGW